MTTTSPVEGRSPTDPRPALTLIATCIGLFLGQVDTTAVNFALPAMGADLSGGLGSLQWVVDG
jgi:MFS transporter, DHA2 family, methylenomycin A resistance protein